MSEHTQNLQASFLDEGVGCYIESMSVLRDFRSIVMESAKGVVKSRLSALGSAIGSELDPANLLPYVYPDRLSQPEWNGLWAWVAVKINLAEVGTGYFGILWGGLQSNQPQVVQAAAMIHFQTKSASERFMASVRLSMPEAIEDLKPIEGPELILLAELPPDKGAFGSEEGGLCVFEARLGEMIDRWIEILSAVRQLQSPTSNR